MAVRYNCQGLYYYFLLLARCLGFLFLLRRYYKLRLCRDFFLCFECTHYAALFFGCQQRKVRGCWERCTSTGDYIIRYDKFSRLDWSQPNHSYVPEHLHFPITNNNQYSVQEIGAQPLLLG